MLVQTPSPAPQLPSNRTISATSIPLTTSSSISNYPNTSSSTAAFSISSANTAQFSSSCPARVEQTAFATKLPILRFPNELILLVAEDLSTPDLNSLSQCSVRLSQLLTARLHTRGLVVLPANGESVLHWAAAKGFASLVERLLDSGANVELATHYKQQTPLFHAVEAGHVDMVALLLARGADINRRDGQQDTVLRMALSNAHVALVRLLLDHGADVTLQNKYGETPLHLAPFKMTSVVRQLLDAGADVGAKDGCGHSALHLAAQYGSAEVCSLLLEVGAAVGEKDSYGLTPLHRAVRNGDDAVLKLLVGVAGVDVNMLDDEGATPLHTAADAKSRTKVLFLLAAGADVEVRDHASQTALHRATATTIGRRRMKETLAGQADIVTALLDAGADVNWQDARGRSAIHYAAQLEQTGVLSLLLARGAHAGIRDRHSRTALHYAAWHGNEALAEILLRRTDVNITETNLRGKSALHYAALSATRWSETSESLTRLLIRKGFNVNHRDNSGKTPLYYALTEGNTHVAEALLAAGSDISLRTNDGLTVLHAAAKSRYSSSLLPQLLVHPAADINARDDDGKTPLFHALWFDCLDAVRDLLEASPPADPTLASNDGQTPLHLAARKGYRHLLPRLFALGANVNAADIHGETAFHAILASSALSHPDRYQTVQLLIDAGIDVNAQDSAGCAALHLVVMRTSVAQRRDVMLKGVRLLVGSGADLALTDGVGRTAMDVAVELGRREMVQILEVVEKELAEGGLGRLQLGLELVLGAAAEEGGASLEGLV